ncbi:hypothetical protein POF50_004500 [Streptomyces sp. SL13]|uniref:Uncharacterized protein n=1 Tax=Streptantibioticus silvisoli TaxID=2705255 RepID=A0AA90H1T6_9ACTN|nr:hypothetical protein [Streptantibioticus silvisoli]MDI5968612.1 hypothetical protein [Streptantibioticus silvisoli]
MIAEENDIELAGRRPWSVGVAWKIFQATLNSREHTTRRRAEEARRIARGLGDALDEDLLAPRAMFVRGRGKFSFSEYQGWHSPQKFLMSHVRLASAAGQRVDLVLFGSLDNVRSSSFLRDADNFETGWTSSAAPAIDELLRTRGRENEYYNNEEEDYRSCDALQMALRQGMSPEEQEGRPETRGMTLGQGVCEFVAEVYTDVTLDPERWHHHDDDPLAGTERIIVGRPLWVREPAPGTAVSYAVLRNGPAWERRRWLRRLHLVPRRSIRSVNQRRPPATAALFGAQTDPGEPGEIGPQPVESQQPIARFRQTDSDRREEL